MEGYSLSTVQGVLSAIFQGQSFVLSEVWLQLHIGAPDADGTANVAVNDVRMDASTAFGTAPDDTGMITSDAVIGPWASVPADEQYTHCTVWSASTGGTFAGSGVLAVDPVNTGDSFSIPAGSVTATAPVAS